MDKKIEVLDQSAARGASARTRFAIAVSSLAERRSALEEERAARGAPPSSTREETIVEENPGEDSVAPVAEGVRVVPAGAASTKGSRRNKKG